MASPIHRIREGPSRDGYREVALDTPEGEVACRHYASPGAREAALFVGGVGGGWDSPARGLYPALAERLRRDGIHALRVRYRAPTDLEAATHDVLAGLAYLDQEGVEAVALVGHSLGGAVAIRAAARSALARTVVTLATQSYGAEDASRLPPGCSLLLVHGTEDDVLPAYCSAHVFATAREPKRLVLAEDAGHGLDEAADEVFDLVHDWIYTELRDGACESGMAPRGKGR